jgi:cell division protein ZipA
MDFAMREWLTIIIVLLILGVLLDGWRRMRQSKRQSIKMTLKTPKFEDRDVADNYGSELPNGGARVIGHRDEENTRELTRSLRNNYGKKKKVSRSRPPEQTSLNLDEEVPMLMDSVEEEPHYQEPSLSYEDEDFEPEDILMTGGTRDVDRQPSLEQDRWEKPSRSLAYAAQAQELEDGEQAGGFDPSYDPNDFDPNYDPNDFDPDDYDPEDYADDLRAEHPSLDSGVARPSERARATAETEPPYESGDETEETGYEPEEVLVINVMSVGNDRFRGDELLDVIVDCGMRYGDMQIFHRHHQANGKGPLLFSMANMVKPGTFELNAMDEFETPGVSLFMTLPMQSNSMEAFNIMADTAMAIADHLGGELKDEHRSVMTAQTLEHCRQRIRDFERKLLSRG